MADMLVKHPQTLGFSFRYVFMGAGLYIGAKSAFFIGNLYLTNKFGEDVMRCFKSTLADGTKWQVEDPEVAMRRELEARKQAKLT